MINFWAKVLAIPVTGIIGAVQQFKNRRKREVNRALNHKEAKFLVPKTIVRQLWKDEK